MANTIVSATKGPHAPPSRQESDDAIKRSCIDGIGMKPPANAGTTAATASRQRTPEAAVQKTVAEGYAAGAAWFDANDNRSNLNGNDNNINNTGPALE